MDGSSPFFSTTAARTNKAFFFSEAPHYVSMFRFMATLREIWILPINPKYPVIMASNYCHCVYQIMFTPCLI